MCRIMNRLCLVLTAIALASGAATLAQAAMFNVSFDPFDGMGAGDWPPGTLLPGSDLPTINTVYGPDFGIEFGEHADNAGQASLGECCGGNHFLNAGKASDGHLHWFVNATDGNIFPAGSTISVNWNNNTGGPSTLKAYAGTIAANMATVDNGNDGSAFGGLVGEATNGFEQFTTLNLQLTADARSFTVHQSAIDFANDSSFITGEIMGEPVAPNVSINDLSYELVAEIPEPSAGLVLVIGAVLVPAVLPRRHRA